MYQALPAFLYCKLWNYEKLGWVGGGGGGGIVKATSMLNVVHAFFDLPVYISHWITNFPLLSFN